MQSAVRTQYNHASIKHYVVWAISFNLSTALQMTVLYYVILKNEPFRNTTKSQRLISTVKHDELIRGMDKNHIDAEGTQD